jgi:hypothetical protein
MERIGKELISDEDFANISQAIKNSILWDVTPCGCCKNRHFGGTYRLHHHGDKKWRARNNVYSN